MLPTKTILVVDDEQDIRETLAEALELIGFKATTASNGNTALKLLKASNDKPALILLDLMMPEMDGFEFMKAKGLISEIANIPVIVISANGYMDAKFVGFNIQGYLKKPINLDKLLETAEKYCC